MLANQARRFGETLVDRHVLSRDDLEQAIDESERTKEPLPSVLLRLDLVGSKDLTAALAEQMGVRFIDFLDTPIHQDAPETLSAELARQYVAVPVDFEGQKLVVAFAEPPSDTALTAVGHATSFEVIPAVADRSELMRAIAMIYGAVDGDTPEFASTFVVGDEQLDDELHINDLLDLVIQWGGSDLHLASGSPPVIRVNGDLRPVAELPIFNGSQIRQMVFSILTQKQREKFENELELDTSYALPGRGRFRVNVFVQRDSVGCVMRAIPYDIVEFERLGIAAAVQGWAHLPRGLILVTGPTGSGKSTTLASLIDIVNRERAVHIMTVEDPIEFLHQHKRSLINQREVGEDTHSFANALKHVLRQDPDVILVGEMRDLETISTALTAAETGHLVFATLHTQDAPQSIDRVIDVFPAHQQQQVRVQLAAALQGICTQQLIPTVDGQGRAVACEVMVATPAIRNLIREGKTHQIYSMLQAGGRYGMVTMDMSLAQLVRARSISVEMAIERCANEEDLRRLLNG
ncbi:MAG TPA: PilT/PilU family type 4a pilus ATPase [Acidimicrobiia bacterium]